MSEPRLSPSSAVRERSRAALEALRGTPASGAFTPYLAGLWSPPHRDDVPLALGADFRVATYNVHRWAGVRGGKAYRPERVFDVLARLDADVVALQEVLLPDDSPGLLADLARETGRFVAFAPARRHKRGELGNAIASRVPIATALAIDLTTNVLEQRAALAIELPTASEAAPLVSVVATHLALVDRLRHRQVHALLGHPQLHAPVVLLGDMNAWRQCRATRHLDASFAGDGGAAAPWPPSYPAPAPVLALDRIYARGAAVADLAAVQDAGARQASDHLPVVATVRLG